MTLFSGQVVKRKPEDVVWETPLQKGVREIVDKHMSVPPETTPKWRKIPAGTGQIVLAKEEVVPEKEGMGPYEGNWHPDDSKPLPWMGHCKKLEDVNIRDMVRREVEWYLSK